MNKIFPTALLLGTMCAGSVLAQTTTPPPAATPSTTMAPAATSTITPPSTMPPAAATTATTPPPAMAPAVTTPAVTSNGVNTAPGAPLAGANSFTMAQAQSRLKDHGFSQVSDLVKDEKSVWRGHAMKDGKTVDVAVDYQGNITTD
jgi:hypothetical protein